MNSTTNLTDYQADSLRRLEQLLSVLELDFNDAELLQGLMDSETLEIKQSYFQLRTQLFKAFGRLTFKARKEAE